MKRRFLMAGIAFAACLLQGTAQRSPEHPFDFNNVSFSQMLDNFDAWTPGTQPNGVSKMDDEFYISRVRPLKRISGDDDFYARGTTVDPNRKLCMWVPLDDPTSQWKSMPRYCFEGDNFSMWQYVDIHGNWTAPWFRSPAGIADAAHKHGTKIGCVLSVPYAQSITLTNTNSNSLVFQKLIEKNSDGSFKRSMQLVKLLKYYGIDGIGVNSEFSSNTQFMNQWIDFIVDCHKKAKEIGWEFQLHWYDGTNSYGQIYFDRGLASHNQKIFGDSENITTDMLFFNYNWTSSILSSSTTKAKELGRSSYDLYAGFDIQGRGFKNDYWSALKDSKISIGLWGAHSQSLLHQSATDNGTSDYAIQNAYQRKLELTFSGGYRNPQVIYDIKTDASLGNGDLETFHGFVQYLSAKSTIQQLPFVSRFNLGNGLKFRNNGEVTFDHKWYNLSTQDFMPTWRWWITDANSRANKTNISKLIKADMTFDDAYFGGSCLKVSGATEASLIKLFKTKLITEPNYTYSITYKLKNGTETHAKLYCATRDKLREVHSVDIPAPENADEWTTFTATAEQLGLESGSQIAILGLAFENTPADYEMLVGELAVRNPAQTFAPVTPTIKEVEILRGRYNALDYKIRYAAREETGETKTYNDEVDTWYYEIYFQQENQPEQLITATTSWAAYVIDAPLVPGTEGRRGRFGVRAVAPNGTQFSDIAWTDYQDLPYNDEVSDVEIDKPVVKPGETFNVSMKDVMGQPAIEWKIVDPLTGNTMATKNNSLSLSTSISKEGLYDLCFTDHNGNTTITRGMVQITPESTGAVPEIITLTGDKTTATVGEDVTYNYTARRGEGSVSRALEIMDPNMFMVPGEVQEGKTYSYALWFKADNFGHDKQGTNLINKNTIADAWPHNNWGDLWVTIRPAIAQGSHFGDGVDAGSTMTKDHAANEVSFNTMGWSDHGDPCEYMMSTDYSVTPGVWTHVVVTQEGNDQKMYFNGRRVATYTFAKSKRREDVGLSDTRINTNEVANIFIGGGGVYKAGFNGWIDEVQVWNKALSDDEVLQAMKGYDAESVPEGLQAYYTFEKMNADGTFPNLGKGQQAWESRNYSRCRRRVHRKRTICAANSRQWKTWLPGHRRLTAHNG